jgi:hypothetical protein
MFTDHGQTTVRLLASRRAKPLTGVSTRHSHEEDVAGFPPESFGVALSRTRSDLYPGLFTHMTAHEFGHVIDLADVSYACPANTSVMVQSAPTQSVPYMHPVQRQW